MNRDNTWLSRAPRTERPEYPHIVPRPVYVSPILVLYLRIDMPDSRDIMPRPMAYNIFADPVGMIPLLTLGDTLYWYTLQLGRTPKPNCLFVLTSLVATGMRPQSETPDCFDTVHRPPLLSICYSYHGPTPVIPAFFQVSVGGQWQGL